MTAHPLPLAAANERRKGKPGRPRKGERPLARSLEAAGLSPVEPRLLDVHRAAFYLSCSAWTVRDLIASGTLQRVLIPAGPGRDLRRVLLDRQQLDELVLRWREAGR